MEDFTVQVTISSEGDSRMYHTFNLSHIPFSLMCRIVSTLNRYVELAKKDKN